jgi:plasmid maintenance system antidote protein VapI
MNIFLEKIESLNLSYTEVSQSLGFDIGYFHKVLHGKKALSPEFLVKLSRYLGIDKETAITAWKDMEADRKKIAQAFEER